MDQDSFVEGREELDRRRPVVVVNTHDPGVSVFC